jgi:hypothetical protein
LGVPGSTQPRSQLHPAKRYPPNNRRLGPTIFAPQKIFGSARHSAAKAWRSEAKPINPPPRRSAAEAFGSAHAEPDVTAITETGGRGR